MWVTCCLADATLMASDLAVVHLVFWTVKQWRVGVPFGGRNCKWDMGLYRYTLGTLEWRAASWDTGHLLTSIAACTHHGIIYYHHNRKCIGFWNEFSLLCVSELSLDIRLCVTLNTRFYHHQIYLPLPKKPFFPLEALSAVDCTVVLDGNLLAVFTCAMGLLLVAWRPLAMAGFPMVADELILATLVPRPTFDGQHWYGS